MIYIGMDVSSKEFVIHAIDQRQQKVFEGKIPPSRSGLRKLVKDFGVGTKLFVFECVPRSTSSTQRGELLPATAVNFFHLPRTTSSTL